MKILKSLVFLVKAIILALVLDLFPALKNFFELIREIFRHFFGSKTGVRRQSCTHVAHPSFKRPDPMIYDQYYLMSLGLAVSWQNPDIQILEGGVPVASSYQLKPSTTYTIRATIYNGSTEGIVYDMPVIFSYLSFGVGTVSNPIPGPYPRVSLGVKGTLEGIATVELNWTTPATPGHYCLQVSFDWPDDLNPNNNLGQENTQVVQAASPAAFTFQLRNTDCVRRQFRFEMDTFQMQSPPPCSSGDIHGRARARPQRGSRQQRGHLSAAIRQRNSRADNPLPIGWSMQFSPSNPVLDPDEEITVTGVIDPPDTFHGALPVNIHAFSEAGLVGGVTVMVNRA